ncbi:MAG: beta-lactamase hydrolase domain-containing protein [Phycisphaerales bacterium JB043]
MKRSIVKAGALACVVCGCSSGYSGQITEHSLSRTFHDPVMLDEWRPRFNDTVVVDVGGVWIAGQPSEEALEELAADGFTTVICLRGQRELDNRDRIPYDVREKVESLDMEWVHIPMTGEYGAEYLERFAEGIEGSEGRVLVHCTVAWRASHMWGAYLARYHGYSYEGAWEIAGRIYPENPSPFERLLEIEMARVMED